MPPVSDALLAKLSALVETRLGLSYPPERRGDLEKSVILAAAERGSVSSDSYVQRLLNPDTTDDELEALVENLTVGETYFFREKPSFAALERHILPELIAARRAQGRRLRFWSAGCCTGEEPYSLAILLTRLLPDIADWDVTILATDINMRFLKKAADGVYGEWSFRNVPSWLKRCYFHNTPEGRWAIQPRIKQMVTLRSLNLASDDYPSAVTGARAMDVILCRNVLLYMSPEQTMNIIQRLRDTLCDGGWLSVAPAETSAIFFAEFSSKMISGATMYQKAEPAVPFLELPHAHSAASDLAAVEPFAQLRLAEPTEPRDAPDEGVGLLASARACADAGELAKALAWCDQAIAEDRAAAASHYLRAVILQEQGSRDQAVSSLRSALLLDPNFILAHFALGSLARGLGREEEAKDHLLRAYALLQKASPTDLVPESEGIAAGRLLEMIDMMLAGEPMP